MSKEVITQALNLLQSLPPHRSDLSIVYARKVLEIEPGHRQAWFHLTSSLAHLQHFPELLSACKQTLRLFPEEGWPYFFLGDYYFYHCQSECYYYALQMYKHTLRLNPFEAATFRQIGEIYLINWEPFKAADWFRKAVQARPSQPEYQSRLALAELRCHNIGQALKLAESALALDPVASSNVINCAMVLLYSGELDKAESLCRRALAQWPDYSYMQRQLTNCLNEKADRQSRQQRGLKYTPLYLRQKGNNKHFDEDLGIITVDPNRTLPNSTPIPSPWELFPDWELGPIPQLISGRLSSTPSRPSRSAPARLPK